MNLRQLRHFTATVEAGSLGRASQRLHLSLPALSKSIQNLEDSVGAKLLDRGPAGMTPTVYGRALIAHAKLIQAQVDRARSEIGEIRGLVRGRLAFGAGPSIVQSIVPQALTRFTGRHPEIRVSVIEGYAETQRRALLDGSAEFVIAPSLGALPPADIALDHLFTDRIAVVCRAGHPLARRRQTGLVELAAWPWIQVHRPDSFRQTVESAFEAEGIVPPSPVLEANSLPLIKATLRGSDALTLLPLPAIRDDPALIGLRKTPFDADRKVFAIRRSLGVLSPLAEALLAEIRNVAKSA